MCFIVSNNICFNIVNIIKNNLELKWDFNIIKSLFNLYDYGLLFGTLLLSIIFILFIIKYDKELKLKLQKIKKLPKEDGSYEYGSSRWATKKEVRKNYKTWNKDSKLKSGGIPVTYMDGKFYYSDSFEHTLIVGSTGSGKTVSCILPLIFNLGCAGESH